MTEDFDSEKIFRSLDKAIRVSGQTANQSTEKFVKQVIKYLDTDYTKENFTSDDVRSVINIVLLDNNLAEVAKIYFKTRGQKIIKDDMTATQTTVKQIKKRDGAIVAFDQEKNLQCCLESWRS